MSLYPFLSIGRYLEDSQFMRDIGDDFERIPEQIQIAKAGENIKVISYYSL